MMFSDFVTQVCTLLKKDHCNPKVGVLDLCNPGESTILNVFLDWYNQQKTPEQTAKCLSVILQGLTQYFDAKSGATTPLPDLTQKFELNLRSSLGKRNPESIPGDLHPSTAKVQLSFDQGKMNAIIWLSDDENRTLIITMMNDTLAKLQGHLSQQVEYKRRLDNGEYTCTLADSRTKE